MDSLDSLLIVRVWAAAAWADGRLDPAEAAALRRLIEASTELDAARRREAMALLRTAPSLDLAEVKRLRSDWREGIYRAARTISRLDGKVTGDEVSFLTRLRAVLDLDEAILKRIESESA
ncbi:TerB family tellurite resistance protein [Pendulispora brunnea]|uniref:TerB family tellurite resistance protein n=1 Tax=Pendulispora brunnea TaxID=2905690 RepID=A0ABZ2JX97_9BACT